MASNLSKKAISGVKWATLAKFINIGVGIIKISILTRFLSGSDFGLMAIVNVTIGFADLFMDMGLSTAILHKQNITPKEYSSLYWLNFLSSIFLYLIALGITPYVALYYHQPELNILIPLVAINFILSAIGRQFNTIFQKELDFYTISVIEIISVVASLILAIVLALNNYGVYALAYSSILQFVLFNIILLFVGYKKHKIALHFSLQETYPFLKIGIYQVGGQIINFFSKELDVLIIGRMLGAEVVGLYSLAKNLAVKPIMLINPIITEIATPFLSVMQDNKEQLKQSYLKLIRMTTAVNFVIYLLMFIFSDVIIHVLYGQKFESCVVILRLFCSYMYLRSIYNPVGSLLVATGRTDLDLKWNIFMVFMTSLLLYIGSMFNINGIVISLNVLLILIFIPAWYIFYKNLIDLSLKDYLKAVIISKSHYTFLFDILKQNNPFKKKVSNDEL
jgi:O-antigen/teichoic acid export membrane protein